MPRSIARQRVTKNRIAGRSIAARYGLVNLQTPFQFPPGSYTFTVPKSGYWLFAGWSGGSKTGATNAGCSGAYGEITKVLVVGQAVTIKVGPEDGSALTNTILTFPDGTVSTLVNAAADTPGTATGTWDYSLAGSLGGLTGTSASGAAGAGTGGGVGGVGSGATAGGGGAPAKLPFRGAIGGGFRATIGNFMRAGSPGGGGSDNTTSNADVAGEGLVLTYLVRE